MGTRFTQQQTSQTGKPFNWKLLMAAFLLLLSSASSAQTVTQTILTGNGKNTAVNPNSTTAVTVPANTFNNIAATVSPGDITAIRISAFPSGVQTLTVGGTSYTLATFPAGGIDVTSTISGTPTQTITVDPINNGETTVVIPYKALAGSNISQNTGSAVLSLTGTPVISCATKELTADPNFITSPNGQVAISDVNSNGWTATGSGSIGVDQGFGYVYISDDVNTQTFNHDFTGVNPSSAGAVISVDFGLRNGVLPTTPPFTHFGYAAVITFKYGGVPYATVTTDNTTASDGHTATLVYLNGATGSLPNNYTFDYGSTPQSFNNMNIVDWKIYLPTTIPNNGILSIEFDPAGTSTLPSDDIKLGAVSLKACPLLLSGNVYNDVDGLTDALVDNNGGAQPASTLPTGLTANLFNATTGAFVATVTVQPDGTYIFPDVTQNTNYIVILSNVAATGSSTTTNFTSTLPAGWVNTGDVNPTDPTATAATPGVSAVIEVGTAHTTNVNFGIEQPPTAVTGTLPSQGNPGGTISVTVPATYFDGNDVNGGTVTSITITTFPTNATSFTIGTTTYYPNVASIPGVCPTVTCSVFPATGGVNVSTNASGNPTQPILIDPVNGTITSVITYTATDNAGVVSAPATVSVPFSNISLSGTIYNDIDGLNDSPTGLVDNNSGAQPASTLPTGLTANLFNATTGAFVASVPVQNDGTYIFPGIAPNTNYTVILSSVAATGSSTATTFTSTMPTGWVNTGDVNPTDPTATALTPGISSVVEVGTGNQPNVNFGIEKLPETAINLQPNSSNPGGFNGITLPPGAFQTTNVGAAPGTLDYNGGAVTSIRITEFPTGVNSITIDGITYINGGTCPPATTCTTWPAGGVTIPYTNSVGPTVPVSVDPIDGNITVIIKFAAIDNAGKEDLTPGSITVPFGTSIITGTVINDINNSGSTNGSTIQDGSEFGTTAGATLWAYLISGGVITDSTQVAANGTYTLEGSPGTTYTIEISQQQYSIGTTGVTASTINNTMATGWTVTGEGDLNTADGTANGTTTITTPASGNSVNNNFGVLQPISCAINEMMTDTRFIFTNGSTQTVSPNTLNYNGWVGAGNGVVDISSNNTYVYDNDQTQTFTHVFTGVNPLGNGAVISMNIGVRNGIVNGGGPITNWGKAITLTISYGGTAYATITSDPTTGSDGHIATIHYFNGATGSVPDGFQLDYGTSPQDFMADLLNWQIFLPVSIPTNGNLVLEFNPGGTSSTDAADDFIIPTVSLKKCGTDIGLPITLQSFTGKSTSCNATELNWIISDAINFSHFEVEKSANGTVFTTAGLVIYDHTYSNYTFKESNISKGNYQYRLKMIDTDGSIKYSPVVFIKLDCNQQQILLYPNPAINNVTITGLKNSDKINLYTINGSLVYSNYATGYQHQIDMTKYNAGGYKIIVSNEKDGILYSTTIIKALH